MQITRQADYALRAILYLARHELTKNEPDWRPATTSKIAKESKLERTMQALSILAPKVGLPEGLSGWESLSKNISGSHLSVGVLYSARNQIQKFKLL